MVMRYQNVMEGRNGYGELSQAPLLNFEYGGQHGHQSDLRYMLSGQDYVSRQLICKVMRLPTMLQSMSGGQRYMQALVQIFETYAQTWEGFTKTLTTAVTESPISGAGEMLQSHSKVTRARSEPVLGLPDKYNLTVSRIMEFWQQELLQDPDTGIANFFTRNDVNNMPQDQLLDRYTAVCLFFEPDPTFTYATKAWLVGNMFPLSSGEITARRDKTAEGELSQLSIPFAGYSQHGRGPEELARRTLASMNITGTNPNLKPAFVDGAEADVNAVRYNYVEKVNQDSRTFLRP